jgi:hypothetical protein
VFCSSRFATILEQLLITADREYRKEEDLQMEDDEEIRRPKLDVKTATRQMTHGKANSRR